MTDKVMKYDGGKPLAGIPFQDFSRALMAVAEVGTFGAKKYSRSSWRTVPEALTRYLDAKFRHILMGQTEERDQESGLLHAAHEAWNALATLELLIEAQENTPRHVMTKEEGFMVMNALVSSMEENEKLKADRNLQSELPYMYGELK